MRFWVSRDASASIREQLAAQLILGILSRKYAPGQRLPSVRELARRLRVHANTVSGVYKDLAARGWVQRRVGAGVYVNDRAVAPTAEAYARECFALGLQRGFLPDDLRSAFSKVSVAESPRECTVLDPDPELARVVALEIEEAIGRPVRWGELGETVPTGNVLANEAYASELTGTGFRPLRFKSTEQVFAGRVRPQQAVLIAVVSRSSKILEWSSTLLSALGFPPECVVQRVPGTAGWTDGLPCCDIVGADVVAVTGIPDSVSASVFRIVQEEFLVDLRSSVTVCEV